MICALSTNRTPLNSHGLPTRELVGLRAFYFLFFAAIAFMIAFLPIFLSSRGLTLSQIGLVIAAFALSGALTQGPLGHLSDVVGSRRYLGALCCAWVGASYFFYPHAHSVWAFVLLSALTGAGWLGGFTLPQAIISDWTSATGTTARGFSSARIWGTLGFLSPLVAVFGWPGLASGTGFLYYGAVLYLASGIPLLLLHEARVRATTHGMLTGTMRVLTSQRAYAFLLCYTVFRLCSSAKANYLGLYIKGLGGDEKAVAAAYALAAMAEVPVVLLIGKISDRFGRKWPLAVAFIIHPLNLYLYSLVTVPSSIYYLQLLGGLTFGIVLVVGVAYISDVSPMDLRGTAQGLFSVSNAAAMAIGPVLAGIVGDRVGLAVAFRVMAIIMVVTLVAFLAFVKEPKRINVAGNS